MIRIWQQGYEAVIVCTTWEQKDIGWDSFFIKITVSGYQGVETGLPAAEERQAFLEGLKNITYYTLGSIGKLPKQRLKYTKFIRRTAV